MIAYLEGNIADKTPAQVIIDVQGVGYEVSIPISTFEQLGESGQRVKLLTHQHVREDVMQLFGFSTIKEKVMFKKLLSVSGIGPKLALAILSGSRVDDLTLLITNSDIDGLTRLPGVGKKTAQRIILELKDKLDSEASGLEVSINQVGTANLDKFREGVIALTSLGFSKADAERSLTKMLNQDQNLALDELIRRSLQRKN